MIVKILRGSNAIGLMAYLMSPKKALTRDHVEAFNIVNVDLAGEEMTAVFAGAPRQNRIRAPYTHFMLGWHASEDVTLERQKAAARRLLEKLDLTDNQSIIVVHDEPKAGLVPGLEGRPFETHIAINRVRLDGTVDKLHHDYARAEIACAEIADEMGFARIPGRFNGGAADLLAPGIGNTIGSIKAQTGMPTLADEVRQDHVTLKKLRDARGQDWITLLSVFRDSGIIIRPGRQGVTASDTMRSDACGVTSCGASSVGAAYWANC